MILVTGKGTSGSWRVRGEQLGAAIGARVKPRASDLRGFDAVVVVKRVSAETLAAIRSSGVRFIYDIVDAWPQPEGNSWSEDRAITWLRGELKRLQPSTVVFTTSAMREDSGWEGPSLVLPHHAWPRYSRNPERPVEIVGYEGGARYLGAWRAHVERECRKRGWRFQVNGDMRRCDIGIALREDAGHPARRWKSNCKLANLQALGVPAVCSPECGYLEFGSGAELYAEDPADLAMALDICADAQHRKQAAAVMHQATPTLKRVAEQYRSWLDGVAK
jgi:hypothetical protein